MSDMKVMPSIDLSSGKAVKRVRGVKGSELVITDAIKAAEEFYELGYDSIHVVDLDAAEGVGDNEDLIRDICKVGFRWIQVGGGVRDRTKASRLLSYGVNALVISTLFYLNRGSFEELIKALGGDKVLVAIDYGDDLMVRVKGWKESALSVYDAINLINMYDLFGVLFTYIEFEGSGRGVDSRLKDFIHAVRGIKEYAGGVRNLNDLMYLKGLGIDYVIIGMAMYMGFLKGVRYV